MKTARPSRGPCSITATSVICQIDAIVDYATGIGTRRHTTAELDQIAEALWQAWDEISTLSSRAPDDPEVDFGLQGAAGTGNAFEIVRFSKEGVPLTKKISLNADGSTTSDGSACVMSRGIAERILSLVSPSWRR